MKTLFAATAALVSAGLIVIGVVAVDSPRFAVGLAFLLLAAAVSVRFPAVVLMGVLPAAYVSWRVGPRSFGLSIADASLLMGALAAVPFVPWAEPRLRRVLTGLVGYEAIMGLAVVAHPTQRAMLEWGHRILLVGGSLMVGSALFRLVSFRAVLKTYLLASATIAFAAGVYAFTHGFRPAYPFGFQKNAAGLLLAFAFIVTIVAPRLATFALGLLGPLRILLVVGMLATQSRAAMVATIVVLAAVHLRPAAGRQAVPVVVVATLAMLGAVLLVTNQQVERTRRDPTSARFYGIGAREGTDSEALKIWAHTPLLGAGLRYFNDRHFATSEPHNVVVVSVAESGLIGLCGLALLLWAGWSALRGLTGDLATLARIVLAVQVITGLFDIFWVAGRGSFAWVLIGGAVGALTGHPEGRGVAAAAGPAMAQGHAR